MPPVLDARQLAESLIGRTLETPTERQPNSIVRVAGANVIVATNDSPAGEKVALRYLQLGIDMLFADGEVRISPDAFNNYRRTSFIGAALATLPATEVTEPPTYVRLTGAAPLRDQLQRACALITQPRAAEKVVAHDQLHRIMAQELPARLRDTLGEAHNFKVQGSAGQVNLTWAETPWVAVLDRLVTESAQRGHYVVFLVHRNGTGVYLSLMQAVTEARAAQAGRYLELLEANGARLRSYLPTNRTAGLILGPIDLAGGGGRTQGYEVGSVAALWLPANGMPHDAALVSELRRFLVLYEHSTAGLDEEEAAASVDAPDEATRGTESKRYRWHLRAEGRNRSVVRRVKRIQGYTCRVCDREFDIELGELGKRCIDAHHLTPFAELDERPRALDPATDFIVVCANCHRMLHSDTPPLTADELRSRLADG